jgi:hypothetical protein
MGSDTHSCQRSRQAKFVLLFPASSRLNHMDHPHPRDSPILRQVALLVHVVAFVLPVMAPRGHVRVSQ